MTHSLIGARRRLLSLAIAGTLGLAPWCAAPALAADYPSKPIRLVVPFPPGGGTDVMGRLVAQNLAQELKATVIVENLAGATGTVGSGRVARSEPDGYTLLLGISATHAIAPALFKDLPYQPQRDFTAIAGIAHGGNLLVAHPSFPASTVAEFIAAAKRSPKPLAYGSWGIGSGGHLAAEGVRLHAGLALQHVPYKGVAPMLQDLLGGQILVAMSDLASTAPLVRSGKLKALAVTGPKRSAALPDVPTLAEQGVPFDTESWYALFVPAKTPPAIVEQLSRAVARVLKVPEVAEKVASLGMEPTTDSREVFERQWHKDIATWARVVEASGTKME